MTAIRDEVARAIDPAAFDADAVVSRRPRRQIRAGEAADRAIAAHLAALRAAGYQVVDDRATRGMGR